MLIDKGYKVDHEFVKGWGKDTGAPEDILEANRLVLDELKPQTKGIIEDKNSIQGRVSVGESTIIKKGSLIRGPAIIGENATIEANVYIGPYTSIGNNAAIKRGEIENFIIMDHCLIDVDERIIDSLIAPHSKIVSSANNKLSTPKLCNILNHTDPLRVIRKQRQNQTQTLKNSQKQNTRKD